MNEIILPSGVSVATTIDKRQRKPVDYPGSIKAIQYLQDQQQGRGFLQPEATVKIDTSDPVLVVYTGDEHIGNVDTRHDKILEMDQKVLAMRNTFMVKVGDLCDQMFWVREAGTAEALTEDMQGEIAMNSLKQLDDAGRMISYTSGNHDHFVRNFYPTYMGGFKFPLIGENHGTVHLGVGKENYDVLTGHKISMGNSTMSNYLRGQKALEYWNPQADIVVMGHTHRKGVAQHMHGADGQKKLRTFIEAGTMKPDEFFQRQQGNVRAGNFDYCGVSTILYPDHREVLPFYDLDQGIEAYQAITGMRTCLSAATDRILRGHK